MPDAVLHNLYNNTYLAYFEKYSYNYYILILCRGCIFNFNNKFKLYAYIFDI